MQSHTWPAESMEGSFWTSGSSPSLGRQGELLTREGAHPRVIVHPALFSGLREVNGETGAHGETRSELVDDDPGPVTIHGDIDVTGPVTVLDARSTSWRGSWPGAEQQQQLSGIRAVVGGHLTGPGHQFRALRLRLQTLPSMAGTPDEWAEGVALSNGGRLECEASADGAALVLTHLPSASLRLLDRSYLQPLVTFLQLATGLASAPMSFAVSEQAAGDWWPVHTASLRAQDMAVKPTVLLRPSRLRVRHLGAWLNRVETLGALPAATASVLAAPPPLESQILTLATVAEGLHRRLHPDSRRLSDDVADRTKAAAVDAVERETPEATDTVRGLLSHLAEPGFARRLADLAEGAETLVPGITGATNRWKRLINEARNDMAHQLGLGWLEEQDIDRYVTAAFSLKWVLIALLLREADISADAIASLFAEHQEYGLFLQQARDWQPRVYGVAR